MSDKTAKMGWPMHCDCMYVHACLQTAATLHEQTQQLNKVVDDLNEIEFSMKKATKVIADIGKGIMTDRHDVAIVGSCSAYTELNHTYYCSLNISPEY